MIDSSTRLIARKFARQFEPDGATWLYRHNMRDAPVVVSTDERARFIEDYARGARRLSLLIVLGALVVLFAVAVYVVAGGREVYQAYFWAALALLTPPWWLGWRKLWDAPKRALAGRPVVGPARSRTEARRARVALSSWSELLGAVVIVAAAIWSRTDDENLLQGWHRLWLVFGAVVVVAAARSALDKWRLTQPG